MRYWLLTMAIRLRSRTSRDVKSSTCSFDFIRSIPVLQARSDPFLFYANCCDDLLWLAKTLRYFIPVDDIPPVLNVLGALVLVFQVIRMFPHIQTKNRSSFDFCTAHKRIVLIWRG